MLIAQIQMTANGLILTDVDGVQVGLPAQDVLELVDWVNERRGTFELMALRAKAPGWQKQAIVECHEIDYRALEDQD